MPCILCVYNVYIKFPYEETFRKTLRESVILPGMNMYQLVDSTINDDVAKNSGFFILFNVIDFSFCISSDGYIIQTLEL